MGGAAIDLDLFHWCRNGLKREPSAAKEMVAQAASGPRWVIEGAYGWLAAVALPRATALIWLDLPWSECRAGLLGRGLRRGMSHDDQAALLSWASAYWERGTSTSYRGHLRLFEDFEGEKLRLRTRSEVDALVAEIEPS
jgi:hypothetical protein